MTVMLPTEEAWFRKLLTETVVWCTGLPIENEPVEDSGIKRRRLLGTRAGELNRRAFLSNAPQFWKTFQHRRARRLFAKARLETIAPLHNQLRSAFLKSQPFLPGQSVDERALIVRSVVTARGERLRLEGRYPATPIEHFADGKLLLFAPEETLSDGAATYASKGFFDVDNIPPWDTWVCYFERYVVSWVPPRLVALANAGIDANPEQCISWG
jgi:hypothetical protein